MVMRYFRLSTEKMSSHLPGYPTTYPCSVHFTSLFPSLRAAGRALVKSCQLSC